MTVTAAPPRGNAVWWSVLCALCLVLLAPLAVADLPPVLDYPNHLARLYVLAFVRDDSILARFYEPHWRIIPNLALDLTVPPLLRIWPVHTVGRLMVAVTLILPVLGAAAYHRALSGRLSYWPFVSVLFVYNAASLRGFLNFIASVGVALLFAAVWEAWRERRPLLAIPIAAAGAVVLFFCHLTGLVFFAALIGAHDAAILIRLARRGRDAASLLRTTLIRLAAGLAVFAVPIALYAVSGLSDTTGAAEFRSLSGKAQAALFPIKNYWLPLDIATGALALMVPAIGLVRRWCVLPLQASLALVVLMALFIGLPHGYKGTFDLDTRFVIMAAALAPAALVSHTLPRRAAIAIGAGFLLLFLVRMAIVLVVWTNWAGELAAFRAVLAPIQPGDVVLTVRLPRGQEPSIWTSVATARRLSDGTVVDAHLPALLLIEHRAWWPFLFDNPSQQPIQTNEPYRSLAERVDGSPDPIALLTRGEAEMRYFTHVLVVGPEPGPDLIATAGLRRLTGNRTTALFAIERVAIRPPEGSPPPPSAR